MGLIECVHRRWRTRYFDQGISFIKVVCSASLWGGVLRLTRRIESDMSQEYLQSESTVLKQYGATEQGLSSEEAARLLEEVGPNEIEEAKKKTLAQRVLEQVKDPMIIVLIAAAIISGAFGEIADMVIILIVVVVNAILGIYQEGKAEEAIEALRKSSAPHSRVRRGGAVATILSKEIVPGDIVLLEAGDTVPADIRLIEAVSLKIEEAALTGESVPAEKGTGAIETMQGEVPLGDRFNMAYLGTNVAYGRGEGVVVATGMNTEMGRIANLLAHAESEMTPLQKKLAQLSKVLSVAVLAICVFIFFFMVFRAGGFAGGQVFEALLTAVSLAVAAIPEGLVVVVTVLLSIGVTKMSKRNAIIRRLTAVETLGCAQVICSDKTGTLTQNKMTVVEASGDEDLLVSALVLCNDSAKDAEGNYLGDPTETALVEYGDKLGIGSITMEYPRVAEAPFDSDRKLMSTIHENPAGGYRQFTKGALDELLRRCDWIVVGGKIHEITRAHKEAIIAKNKTMADRALRVLAAAYRDYDQVPEDISPEELERGLTFIGVVGMIDPIRPEAKAAIQECYGAGIKVVMITGDHRDTAVAIARDLGILSDTSQAITGLELDEMDDAAFAARIESLSVYARVQPEHKVRIVDAWQKKGKVTAMTGDGVNDAPALKTADIGIGMGITGTDVTKNVADMILVDDNFATIVSAVGEGRRIYDNIRKAVQFLLGSNLSEVLAIFLATLAGWKLFSPIHILWINLITDTFPALALGMEEETGYMEQPPRDPKESIFADGLGVDVIWQGSLIGLLTLGSFAIGFAQSQMIGMTMAFLTLSMCEVFHAMNMRSRTKSIFTLKRQNKFLWLAMGASFVMTLGVIYVPGLNTVFHLTALPLGDFLAATGLAFSVIPLVELVKLVRRARNRS